MTGKLPTLVVGLALYLAVAPDAADPQVVPTAHGQADALREDLKRLSEKLRASEKPGEPLSLIKARQKLMTEVQDLEDAVNKFEINGGSDAAIAGLKAELGRLKIAIDRLGEHHGVGRVVHTIPKRKPDSILKGVLRPLDTDTVQLSAQQAKDKSRKQTQVMRARAMDKTLARRIDVNTEMPYGELDPFGREDTARELTEASIRESDGMVDQIEKAEVAEEKRAVFRALTRLRGAAITSFDGVARSQTGNIDQYAKVHQWRQTHPLSHLADSESDVSKWAFPDNADF